MKTLVTGGGGFLGRYIVEQLLQRGDQVISFSRSVYPELEQAGAKAVQGDLQEPVALAEACRGLDVVFHVAARAGFWGGRTAYYQANVVGTENVIAACRANGVPRLVYTSSPSVIFDNTAQAGIDESHPYPQRYENFYSETKALGEQKVIQANGPGLLTCSLRPHLIFGPRDHHLLPRVVAAARAGRLPQVGAGKNRVDMTYVEDAARAHLFAADALQPGSPVAGSVYFISQDEPVTLWPWLRELLVALDVPPIKLRLPLWAARLAGGALEWVYRAFNLPGEPRLTRFLASELALDHFYDISRAKRDLGYRPQIDMAEATRRTVEYLKAQASR